MIHSHTWQRYTFKQVANLNVCRVSLFLSWIVFGTNYYYLSSQTRYREWGTRKLLISHFQTEFLNASLSFSLFLSVPLSILFFLIVLFNSPDAASVFFAMHLAVHLHVSIRFIHFFFFFIDDSYQHARAAKSRFLFLFWRPNRKLKFIFFFSLFLFPSFFAGWQWRSIGDATIGRSMGIGWYGVAWHQMCGPVFTRRLYANDIL